MSTERARPKGLINDTDFRRFISGRAISEIGTRITREGLPLVAILSAGATAPDLGFLAAVTALPAMFLGPYAGVLADRRRRRPILVTADVLRATLLLTIPAAALLNRLTFAQMLIVGALVSALTIFFRVADQAWFPSFVTRTRLTEGNAYVGAAGGVGEFVGPTAMGALVQGLGGPTAILFDALSYLVSAWSLLVIRRREPPPEDSVGVRPSVAKDAWWGIRTALLHPVLRPLLLVLAAQALFGGFFEALYEIYALKTLHLTPLDIGFLVTSGGFGALLASAVVGSAAKRIGTGKLLVGTALMSGLSGFLIPMAGGTALVAFVYLLGAQVLGDFVGTMFEVTELTLRQTQAPDTWLGRVNGSVGFAQGLLGVLGAIGAGFLALLIGPRDAFFLSATGDVAAAALLLGTVIPAIQRPEAVQGFLWRGSDDRSEAHENGC